MRAIDIDTLEWFQIKCVGLDEPMILIRKPHILELDIIEAEPVRHGRWEHVKKHLWHKDGGEIDMWYLDYGYHNGPGCEVCGASVCEHCEPDWEELECDYGYYICT